MGLNRLGLGQHFVEKLDAAAIRPYIHRKISGDYDLYSQEAGLAEFYMG